MLLIIEDDKMINSLLGRVLQDNGYETESAFDGAEVGEPKSHKKKDKRKFK